MNILVTGANGQLGNEMRIIAKHSADNYIFTDVNQIEGVEITYLDYSGHNECEINPCYSAEYPSPVKRPAYSVLDKSKIKETFGVKVPYWTDSLKICINNLQN